MAEELQTLGSIFRAPMEALMAYSYGRLEGLGFDNLRPAHSALFRNIERDGSRISDLAARAGMTKQSMAELVRYLEAHGYVAVGPDPDDGRAKRVTLTKRGRDVVLTLTKLSRAFEKECEKAMGEKGWAQYRRLAEKLRDVTKEM